MSKTDKDMELIGEFLADASEHNLAVEAVYEALNYMKDFECNSIAEALNAARKEYDF